MIRSLPAAAALALVMHAGPGQAQAPAEARAPLADKVAVLDHAMSTGALGGAMDVLPPRLIDAMSARFELSREQLRQAMVDASAGWADDIERSTFSIDLDRAERRTTPGGGRTYYLAPTETVVKVRGGPTVRSRSHTLVLEDGGWWLIRVADAQQIALLREVYPEFTGVDFPADSTAVLD
jgi:hypothetical protein